MDRKELESALEAILFASGEPVQVDRICVALDIDRPTVEQLLQKLMDYYAYERRGIRLLKSMTAGSFVPHRTTRRPSVRHLRSASRPNSASPRWRF